MVRVTRRFEFSMGHTLHEHAGACAHLHGHNYVALVTFRAEELGSVDISFQPDKGSNKAQESQIALC